MGKSKEDFLEAHEYLDQAIASSKPGQINHHFAIKDKILLDYDLAYTEANRLGLEEFFVADRLNELKRFMALQLEEKTGFYSVVEGLEETASRERDFAANFADVVDKMEQTGRTLVEDAKQNKDELGWGFYSLSLIVSKNGGYGFVTHNPAKELEYLSIAHDLGNLWASSDLSWRLRQSDIDKARGHGNS